MRRIDLGPVSAYGHAVKHGFEGTEEEWAKLQAESGANAQAAAKSAEEAKEAATLAQEVLDNIPEDYASLAARVEDEISFSIRKVESENLFNIGDPGNASGFIATDGKITASSSNGHSHLIPVENGKEYTWGTKLAAFGSTLAYALYLYDEDGNFIRTAYGEADESDEDVAHITITTACQYVRINYNIASKGAVMFVEGETYPAEYIAYFAPYSELTDNVRGMQDNIKKVERQSVNLYDNTQYTSGKYLSLNATSASENTYASAAYTGLISLPAGSYVTIDATETFGATNGAGVGVFTEAGVYTGRVAGTSLGTKNGIPLISYTFASDVHIKINMRLSNAATLMVVAGDSLDDYPDVFVPHEKSVAVEEGVLLSDTMLNQVREEASGNVLKGKFVALNGDSICYGAGASGGYGKIIADRNGMGYQNVAVSGGTITAEQYRSEGFARHWVCRTIDGMSADADYAIVEGGVNDASLGVDMGSITSGYTSELDDTTFCGAMESICKQLLTRFPGKKVGFVLVHKMTTKYSSTYNGEDNYYAVSKQILEKWGIPCCDLNLSVPPLNYIDSLKTAYTHNGDGWHPNEEGYLRYYCDKIEGWMRTL